MNRDYNWYTYENQDVIIVNYDNEKFLNIKGIAHNDKHFLIPISNSLNISKEDTQLCIDDVFAGTCVGGEAIIIADIINPENEQKLLRNQFVTKAYYYDDLIQRELFTSTTSYHDWTSERSKFIQKYKNEDNTLEFLETEWDKITSKFKSGNALSASDVDFNEIWDEINCLREYFEND